ncbi:hypothetical protein [Mariniblastus fucicola]|uniref:Uncharacterized protein n=1 Tax=Mariniblastus fucicola TaxID=980251 RepID=A0A5B9P795_9BACT|nr:hypothetical protein [Mariniblastus fucicola]QEG22194.1 hypothetical protein MFFC18_20550 [Mariniblastus fucicola]
MIKTLGKYIAVGLLCVLTIQVADAQEIARTLPSDLQLQNMPVVVSVEAHAGRPYGIGKVTFRLRSGDEIISRTGATWFTEENDRIHYPVISHTPVRKFLRILTGDKDTKPSDLLTIWFLFEGDEPLNARLHGSGVVDFQIPVEFTRPRRYERFATNWWQNFNSTSEMHIKDGDYPPLVEVYLTSLIGRRLGMDPQMRRRRSNDPVTRTFELLFDVEALRLDSVQRSMIAGVDSATADKPLPEPILWSPLTVSDLPDDIEIEPIAKGVPQECFYLRFGTWDNHLWLQRLTEEYGGDLGRMIMLRGFKSEVQTKFQDQLAIQSSEFDNLFGGNLIADVALIGTDTYFDAGASVGVMFHAHNTGLLKTNLNGKRSTFAAERKSRNVTVRKVTIEGVDGTLLSTPDNRYRSFYLAVGDNHLITTSESIARRFVQASNGKGSLADAAEFRFARFNMPLEREDTLFAYLSTPFLQQLLTPAYQIELRRRNQAVSDVLLLEMATLSASSEGILDVGIPNLIAGGFLPENFGYHPDGGELQLTDGVWRDSLRGRRGYFKPIPDMVIGDVTPDETAWFRERATFIAGNMRSLDPMSIGIQRFKKDDDGGKNVERVVFDARLLPFGEGSYEWLLTMLGPPLERTVARSPDDIIRIEASLQGGMTSPGVPTHQVFGAVQDYLDPNLDLEPKTILETFETFRQTPGYLGAWPNPGYTDWMPRLGAQPDAFGYTYSPLLSLWRLQWNDFSVLAFDQRRLESLKPHLELVPVERPAQLRLEVGDLLNSKIKAWANTITYRRAWQTSIANVRLLNMLVQQFDIAPEDALHTAERMLNVDLVCSLGGEYELTTLPSGRKIWRSSAWPAFNQPQLPDDYVAPVLQWFRGLNVEAIRDQSQFSLHGYIDIQRSDKQKQALPSFNLFKGFGNVMGGEKK